MDRNEEGGKAHTRSARVPQTELNKLESHRGLVTRCYQTYDATNASSNGDPSTTTITVPNGLTVRSKAARHGRNPLPKPNSRHPTAPERFSSEGPYAIATPCLIID